MHKPKLTLAFNAENNISSRRIVKFGATDNQVLQATSNSDDFFGITADLDVISGEPVDVITSGVASVEYGASVAAGKLLTSDAQGRAIEASTGNRTIGVATQTGNTADIGSVLIIPSQI